MGIKNLLPDVFFIFTDQWLRHGRYYVTYEEPAVPVPNESGSIFEVRPKQSKSAINLRAVRGNQRTWRWLLLTKVGSQNVQLSGTGPRISSTRIYWAMWNFLFQYRIRQKAKAKEWRWSQLISSCLQSVVLCSLPCSMDNWWILQTLLNCLIVISRVCWSYFVIYTPTT